MMNELQTALYRTCYIAYGCEKKSGRYYGDYVRDKIYQAACEKTLADYFERLTTLLGSTLAMPSDRAVEMLTVARCDKASQILQWLRSYSNTAAIICVTKKADRDEIIKSLDLTEDLSAGDGEIPRRNNFDIAVSAECLSPLAHGDDMKAGNATLFRKMDVLYSNGSRGQLPFYSGNALRGQMRDLLAKHFLDAVGLDSSMTAPGVNLWFFHALYAGGALEEGSKVKLFMTETGDHGATKADGIMLFRDTLPALSLLGSAIGSRIISGRVNVCDLRPECKQWGHPESIDVSALYTWEFLTRRDDFDGRNNESSVTEEGEIKKAVKSHNMIANTQCLCPGSILHGGFVLSDHISDLEKSALGVGVGLLENHSFLGAENRRGFGQVKISSGNKPDGELYEKYLSENKDEIRGYLEKIGACNAHS